MMVKDPDAVLDYGIDWTPWLGPDTIATSLWLVNRDGVHIDSDSHDARTTTVWLSGGVNGTEYRVTNQITTVAGRTDDRSITIEVKNR